MKKTLSLILFSILLLGCNHNKDLQFGFLFSTKETDRYIKEGNYFKERAEQLGAKVIVDDGEGDQNIQYDKAIEMFDQGIDALVLIAINTNSAAAIVREGQARGIKIIAYNRMVKNCEPDFYISGNNESLGKIMVDAVFRKRKEGNVVILGGDKYDRNAVELQASIDKEIAPLVQSGDLKILYKTFIEEWNDVNAAYELEQYLSLHGTKPDIIFAGYDGIAEAAIRVLEKHGLLNNVLITGQDAEIRGVKNIIAGKQLMTAFHPLKETAYKAAEITFELATDGSSEEKEMTFFNNGFADIPWVKIDSKSVTKENIDEILIQSNFYKKEQVYD